MGEAVDERDVETVLVEEMAKLGNAVVLEQLAGVARGQTKTDPERRGWREPFFQCRRELTDVGEDRRPSVGGMDVRAVGEVERDRRGDLQEDVASADPRGLGGTGRGHLEPR